MTVQKEGSIVADIGEFEAVFMRCIAARELRVARWAHSGQILSYAARAPAQDGARSVVWVPASGAATLHSFCIYHRQYHADFPVPYNVAVVELAEGPRLVSTIVDAQPSELRVGMELTALFEPSGRLVFRPAATKMGAPS